MQTKPKSNSVVTSSVTADGIIHITVLGAGKIEFDPQLAHPSMRHRAEYHGWIQRLADGAAKSRDPVTGKPASPADKLAAIHALAAHYTSGIDQWKVTATGGGRSSNSEIILRALANIGDVEIEVIRSRINAMAEKKGTKPATLLSALAGRKDVAEEIIRLRAEAATASGIDAEGLMEEIMIGE